MNLFPTITNLRSYVSYQFSALRIRAARDRFFAKLTGRNASLPAFPDELHHGKGSRKSLGVKNIPVDKITGTLNHCKDFDHKFRPIQKHLLHRWVNTFISLNHDKWSPILVHKIGEQYFVEDGRHRVSVARAVGMEFIEAKIWEYSTSPKQAERSLQPVACAEPSTSKSYAVR